MGELKPASWYDHQYRTQDVHRRRGEESPWYPLWKWCAERVLPSDVVLELGCGMGGLLPLIRCQRYHGIDFSAPAVAAARAVAREQAYPATVRYSELPGAIERAGRYSVVVACEVLEHLDDDLACLRIVPPGTRVVLTLPRNDSASHVRHFEDADDIVLRYGTVVGINALETVGEHHFGLEGMRSHER